MSLSDKRPMGESGFVEVLINDSNGEAFGYRLVGSSAGPQLVIAGACQMADQVFERLLSIPTLPWMRGNLVLVRLDRLDETTGGVSPLQPLGIIDRTIVLPWFDPAGSDDRLLRRTYHMILRACANLGMISGRGVSRST